MKQRNLTVDVCKGLAIIAMVVGHADCPGSVLRFVFLWHMPIFFLTAGYFFSRKSLEQWGTFVKHRFTGLYVPFVKWTTIVILLNPVFFAIGVLNEKYGNWDGGVTHPMTLKQMVQAEVDCLTTMGGYDVFLLSAFWFLRALLVGSIAFLVLFKLLDKVRLLRHNDACIIGIICALMLLGSWGKYSSFIVFNNINQGGYRELMCVFFMGIGYLFHQHEERLKPYVRWGGLLMLAPTIWFAGNWFSCMNLDWNIEKVYRVPIVAIVGSLFVYSLSGWLALYGGKLRDFLSYAGRNTLPVMVFHIFAYKFICIGYVLICGLEWEQIGCHMVVHDKMGPSWMWVVYTIGGVGIPLLCKYGVDKLRKTGEPVVKAVASVPEQPATDTPSV